ncbi:uncharacterized protein MELLADRAFT_88005 [Melampsora larici-populina 98AG31]|uniref:Alpha-ketoglutarate-dependent dioxygenase AlkB-like domain-containing protein n=1 Tax=Melampsora larici-populina (strain 98AG31 / pathotype 3-4-7) TaxID=747676 RepID=F4RQ30_MELLP|nr:uncharacterized protein MELLADRAFT_88005 [Melampsora larici-populina 98AG31]EGG05335.1 hypothetical protein MELLADRAFT_88005 [Melampsora larici-populina 98AG31]
MAKTVYLAYKGIFSSRLVPPSSSWISFGSSRSFAMASTHLPSPLRPFTLADESCPFIVRGPAALQTAHNPLDFELYRNVFNVEEQSIWAKFLLSILDSNKPPDSSKTKPREIPAKTKSAPGFKPAESYDFEPGEPGMVLSDYRLQEIYGLDQFSDPLIRPLLDRLLALRPRPSSIVGHILHLGPNGQIAPHLDNPCDSGPISLSLGLGGPKVMHLLADEKGKDVAYKILLEPGSVYLHRDSVRYRLCHAFPHLDEFSGKFVGGSQRLSLILRLKNIHTCFLYSRIRA